MKYFPFIMWVMLFFSVVYTIKIESSAGIGLGVIMAGVTVYILTNDHDKV